MNDMNTTEILDEMEMLEKIRFGLIDIDKYYNGDIDFIDYNIIDLFKLIFFVKETKESYPRLSKELDSIIESVFKNWLTPENHKKFKKDITTYKNIETLLAI